MNAENKSPIIATAIATQLPRVGVLNEIAGVEDDACNNGMKRFKIQDKGSGSKVNSFS